MKFTENAIFDWFSVAIFVILFLCLMTSCIHIQVSPDRLKWPGDRPGDSR